MKRRDFSLTLAICGSVLAHATVTELLAEMYINRAGKVFLPGFPAQATAVAPSDVEEPKLGDDTGAGDAVDASSGEQPQEAEQADHAQAFLGLDPQGIKAKSNSAADAWHPASLTPTAAPSPAVASAAPFGVPGEDSDLRTNSADAKPTQSPPQQAEEQQSLVAEAQPQPQPQEMSQPAAPAAATGAPSEQAETESDPVAVVGSAKFRPGKTEIEYGRAHKITRPHLSLAAQADMMTIAGPALTLKITIDATGHVQNVAIFKTSGSSNIDEGCKVAAYDWWFEPAKDHSGKARGDVILFGIRFI